MDATADSLAIYVTEASQYDDEVVIERCPDQPGTFSTYFYVTGQNSGRDDYRVLDAIRLKKRTVVFHRAKKASEFEYMGEVIDSEVVAERPMEVLLWTERKSGGRHMCGEYGDHLKWKKGALNSLGVDVENVSKNLFQTCFIPFTWNPAV